MRYFYGGVVSSRVISVERPGRLCITPSIPDAAMAALEAKGHVYEVRPVGKVIPDPTGEVGVHFLTKRAKVVEKIPWKTIRQYLRFEMANRDEQEKDKEEAMRHEEKVF